MPLTQTDAVEVRQVKGKGRGVFARRKIHEGELIERVPVLVLPFETLTPNPDRRSVLADYGFHWGRGTVALALGYGSLYNHSYRPNARCRDVAPRLKEFIALRSIGRGEEITINYNGDPDETADVGFPVVDGS